MFVLVGTEQKHEQFNNCICRLLPDKNTGKIDHQLNTGVHQNASYADTNSNDIGTNSHHQEYNLLTEKKSQRQLNFDIQGNVLLCDTNSNDSSFQDENQGEF